MTQKRTGAKILAGRSPGDRMWKHLSTRFPTDTMVLRQRLEDDPAPVYQIRRDANLLGAIADAQNAVWIA